MHSLACEADLFEGPLLLITIVLSDMSEASFDFSYAIKKAMLSTVGETLTVIPAQVMLCARGWVTLYARGCASATMMHDCVRVFVCVLYSEDEHAAMLLYLFIKFFAHLCMHTLTIRT